MAPTAATPPAAAGVRFEFAGPVATVTLDRPEARNPQSPQLWAALTAFAAALPETVRVVVVRAEGPAFSAGLDLRMFTSGGVEGDLSFRQLLELDDDALAEQIETYQQAFTWQRRPDLISVAAVQGHAVGAGFQLALACDLRVVAADARFSMRETSLGLVPDLGGTAPLVEAVGYSRALELCVTGRALDAHEAYRLGLATVVVPREDLDDAVADLVAALTAAPQSAVRATKALLRSAPSAPLRASSCRPSVWRRWAVCGTSPACSRGMDSPAGVLSATMSSPTGPMHMMYSFSRQDPGVGRDGLQPGTTRRIAAFARPYLRQIAAFLVLVVIDACLVVATPLLFKKIVDDGVVPGDGSVVTTLALVIALLAVAETGLTLVMRWYSARIGEGLIYDLRTVVFGHVQRMPLAFFARTNTGSLVSRLNNDVIGAQRAFTSVLSGVVSNLISLVLVIATMALLSWQITLLALVMLPLFLLPAKWAGRKLSGLTREQMQTNASLSAMMTERFNVGGAMLVKLFGRPAQEEREFSTNSAKVRDLGISIAMTGRVFYSALTLVASLATALVYGVGGHLVISSAVSLGTLLALAALMGRLYGPLTSLSNVRVDVMTALVSFERVFEVLDLQPRIADKPDAVELSGAATVEFDDVSFRYPRADEVSLASLETVPSADTGASAEILRSVSFTVGAGEMVALVGPSGAGKTTITNLVARLYDATSGTVRVGGYDVRNVSAASLHASVGYVTQDAHMFHDTIRANLLYAAPDATDAQLVDALRAAQVWELVATLPEGLDTVVGDRGYRLSGGERQRLAIARLLLKAPSILVLDEATAHLDSESEAAVQRALDGALRGRTSLVIAHRLSTVRNADQILVVDAGRIVERGTHAELLAAGGLYSDLYHTQFSAESGAEPSAALTRV